VIKRMKEDKENIQKKIKEIIDRNFYLDTYGTGIDNCTEMDSEKATEEIIEIFRFDEDEEY